ncbi:MAG: serine/threonine-protein kinase [Acidobacteriota bacterium]
MSPEQHARAKELFLELADLETTERDRRLEAIDDTVVRRELLSLLRFHDQTRGEATPAFVDYDSGSLINGRYRIVSRLGGGGMGEVYRADDLVLQEPVALKFLRPDIASEHLVREVRLARQVTHASVCRVYDVGTIDDRPFLSMEYVDGEDLASLLTRLGRLPSDRCAPIAYQLFAGLAAAHARGVLHRDLKPANVMIDGRGQVKITDFGIAAQADDPERTLMVGTPAYMAPEQLAGLEVTTRSDLYSLGVVLYEACTGRHPFDGATRDEMLEAHLQRRPAPPSGLIDDLEPRLERLILRCLEKNPSERPGSALAAAAALGGGDPLELAAAVGDTPSPDLVASAGGRGELGRSAAALLALAATLLLVVSFVLTPDARRLDRETFELPPQALEVKAQEVLQDLGWQLDTIDTASGWTRSRASLAPLAAGESLPDPRAPAASSIYFWYRQSPKALISANIETMIYEDLQASLADPPLSSPGMALVVLHPSGFLDELEVVPFDEAVEVPPRSDPTTPSLDIDAILAAAGLDPARFELAPGTFPPPSFADERWSLTGTSAERPDLDLRIELAGYAGRPTYFRLRSSLPGAESGPEPHRLVAAVSNVVDEIWEWYDLVNMLVIAIAVPLAFSNLRRGRGDRRGAQRLAIVLAAGSLLEWIFLGPHIGDVSIEWALVNVHVMRALLEAALIWVLYLALEPTVRRMLPHALVAWTRLLRGHLRDPLVGRNLAVGGVVGLCWALADHLDHLLPRWLELAHLPPAVGSLQLDFASDATSSLGCTVLLAHSAGVEAVFSLLILALLRILMRGNTWAAILAYAVLFTALYAPVGVVPSVSLWTFGVFIAFTEGLVLARFGLLAFAAASFSFNMVRYFPLTYEVDAWYAGAGLFAGAVIAALIAYGLRSARHPGPRPTDLTTSIRPTSS